MNLVSPLLLFHQFVLTVPAFQERRTREVLVLLLLSLYHQFGLSFVG